MDILEVLIFDMNKKSYIKENSFYEMGEALQEGWGKTLRNIDELKDKIQYKKSITLKEFCYSLYGNGYCSHIWDAFKMYCEEDLKYSRKRLIYDAWDGIFNKWITTEYNRDKIYR